MEPKEENTLTTPMGKNKNVTMVVMAMIAVLASYAAYRAFSSGGDTAAAATKVEKEEPATYFTWKNIALGTTSIATAVMGYFAWIQGKKLTHLINRSKELARKYVQTKRDIRKKEAELEQLKKSQHSSNTGNSETSVT